MNTLNQNTDTPTIYSLRKAGFKVRVMHTREYTVSKIRRMSSSFDARKELSCKGGYTKIQITTPDLCTTVIGEAVCHEKDHFNRKIGNQIALGRALKELNTITIQ